MLRRPRRHTAWRHVTAAGVGVWSRTCGRTSHDIRFLALLAEACGKAGQTEEGLRLLAEALAHWELRVMLSLSRLWQRQGKHAEAHQLLAEIYGWFTKGFDTVDLQEAKALLEELA
jgi:hypothetical protein